MKKIFKKKPADPVEARLKPAMDLMFDLDRAEFNRLIDGMKLLFDGLQRFRKVKTIDEKENGDPDIDKADKVLTKESGNYIKIKKKEVK